MSATWRASWLALARNPPVCGLTCAFTDTHTHTNPHPHPPTQEKERKTEQSLASGCDRCYHNVSRHLYVGEGTRPDRRTDVHHGGRCPRARGFRPLCPSACAETPSSTERALLKKRGSLCADWLPVVRLHVLSTCAIGLSIRLSARRMCRCMIMCDDLSVCFARHASVVSEARRRPAGDTAVCWVSSRCPSDLPTLSCKIGSDFCPESCIGPGSCTYSPCQRRSFPTFWLRRQIALRWFSCSSDPGTVPHSDLDSGDPMTSSAQEIQAAKDFQAFASAWLQHANATWPEAEPKRLSLFVALRTPLTSLSAFSL